MDNSLSIEFRIFSLKRRDSQTNLDFQDFFLSFLNMKKLEIGEWFDAEFWGCFVYNSCVIYWWECEWFYRI